MVSATPSFPNKKYSLIYADPPWKYSNNLGNQAAWGAATSAYSTMALEEICALPVRDLTLADCSLVMWSTGPKQTEAHAVLQAWGFKYITFFYVWIKVNPRAESPFYRNDFWKGRGQYTKPNAEFAMLARKGSMLPVYEVTVPQVIITPQPMKHSAKPVEARRGLEQLFGDIPRIELFAREQVPGWDVWGNEAQ